MALARPTTRWELEELLREAYSRTLIGARVRVRVIENNGLDFDTYSYVELDWSKRVREILGISEIESEV